MHPIMSVDEARKLLGDFASEMSDEVVARIVDDAHVLAKMALNVARETRVKEAENLAI